MPDHSALPGSESPTQARARRALVRLSASISRTSAQDRDLPFLRAQRYAHLGQANLAFAQPHAATTDGADAPFTKQLDTHVLKSLHNLGQGMHVAAYEATARLHALDGGQGKARTLCECGLINAEQSAGRAKLWCCYHVININIHVSSLISKVRSIIIHFLEKSPIGE